MNDMNFANNIIIGIISGIISSIIVLLILAYIKPKIKVSDEICAHLDSSSPKYIYKIKVVNLTRSMLTNVHYNLYYCVMHRDDVIDLREVPPRKGPLTLIDKYNTDNTDFAVRLSYLIDESEYPLTDNSKFQFTIYANHVLTNASVCIKKEYNKNSIFKEGIFETGASTKTTSHH